MGPRVVHASNNVWYHGTSKKFDSFELQTKWTFGDSPSETPLFFSPDESFARGYAGGLGRIYKVRLKWRKLFEYDRLVEPNAPTYPVPPEYENLTSEGQDLYDDLEAGKIFSNVTDADLSDYQGLFDGILKCHYDIVETSQFKRWLLKNHYDACYVTGDGVTNVMVFNPNQVEILDVYPAYGKASSVVKKSDLEISHHRMTKTQVPYSIAGPVDGSSMISSGEGVYWKVQLPSERNASGGYLLLVLNTPAVEKGALWTVAQVVVREDIRRQGIAESLYARAAAWAKDKGGFRSGMFTSEAPARMWQRWLDDGRATTLPRGDYLRTRIGRVVTQYLLRDHG